MRFLVALLAGLATAGACKSGGPVDLSGTWPEKTDGYREVTERWTRSAAFNRDMEQSLEVYATFKSPEWRAAYVARTAKKQHMSDSAREALLARQKQAESQHYELQLLVSTYDFRENKLASKRSTWRIALRDANGTEIEPVSIERDRRAPDTIRAEFPFMGDFAEPYIVKFPRAIDVYDTAEFSLVMGNPKGGVKLTWKAR